MRGGRRQRPGHGHVRVRWLVNALVLEALLLVIALADTAVGLDLGDTSAGSGLVDAFGGVAYLNLFFVPTWAIYLLALRGTVTRWARVKPRVQAFALSPLGFPLAYAIGVSGLFTGDAYVAYLLLPLSYASLVRLPSRREGGGNR
jgi:hypothetical protein